MSMWRIEVQGLAAETAVDMELTDEEAAVVRRVADAVTEVSGFGCQPKMRIDAVEGAEAEQ